MRDAGPMRRVDVGHLTQRLECRARVLEVVYAGHHVDDRLRGKAGNRGRADVVDPFLEPWREHALQQRPLGLESTRPLRVVWDDRNALVRHELRARWNEEIDHVPTTVELDERPLLVADCRRLQLSHHRRDPLVDLGRLALEAHPPYDPPGIVPVSTASVAASSPGPKRDADVIFRAGVRRPRELPTPQVADGVLEHLPGVEIATGSSRVRRNATGVGSRTICDGRITFLGL